MTAPQREVERSNSTEDVLASGLPGLGPPPHQWEETPIVVTGPQVGLEVIHSLTYTHLFTDSKNEEI